MATEDATRAIPPDNETGPRAQFHGPTNGTWGRVPIAAAQDQRLSRNDLRVLIALCRYANDNGRCFPGMRTLAHLLALKRQSVNRTIRRLEDLGWLCIIRRYRKTKGGKATNEYLINFPALKEAPNATLEPEKQVPAPPPLVEERSLPCPPDNAIMDDATSMRCIGTGNSPPHSPTNSCAMQRSLHATQHPEVAHDATSRGCHNNISEQPSIEQPFSERTRTRRCTTSSERSPSRTVPSRAHPPPSRGTAPSRSQQENPAVIDAEAHFRKRREEVLALSRRNAAHQRVNEAITKTAPWAWEVLEEGEIERFAEEELKQPGLGTALFIDWMKSHEPDRKVSGPN